MPQVLLEKPGVSRWQHPVGFNAGAQCFVKRIFDAGVVLLKA